MAMLLAGHSKALGECVCAPVDHMISKGSTEYSYEICVRNYDSHHCVDAARVLFVALSKAVHTAHDS